MTDDPSGSDSDRLLQASTAFADRLTSLVADVMPDPQPPFLAEVTEEGTVAVAPSIGTGADRESAPMEVAVVGSKRGHRLAIRAYYYCLWDRSTRYLSVESSQVRLSLKGVNDPLVRLHYERRNRDSELPAAHLHVHGHRDEVLYLLTLADRGRPMSRRKNDKVPTLSALHLPVGGERFRPTLEDVIEIAGVEFGAALRDGWQERLADEREAFRRLQIRALVHDEPMLVADELRDALGFDVVAPANLATKSTGVLRQM